MLPRPNLKNLNRDLNLVSLKIVFIVSRFKLALTWNRFFGRFETRLKFIQFGHWSQNFCFVNWSPSYAVLRINLIPFQYSVMVISAHIGYRDQAFKINPHKSYDLWLYFVLARTGLYYCLMCVCVCLSVRTRERAMYHWSTVSTSYKIRHTSQTVPRPSFKYSKLNFF